jgi:hypothetical protein
MLSGAKHPIINEKSLQFDLADPKYFMKVANLL